MLLTFTLSVLLLTAKCGNALMCYQCSHCDDLYAASNLIAVNCSSSIERPVCEKIVYTMSDHSVGVIARGCQYAYYLADVEEKIKQQYPAGRNEDRQKHFFQVGTRSNQSLVHLRRLRSYYCQFNYCNHTKSIIHHSNYATIIITIFMLIILR